MTNEGRHADHGIVADVAGVAHVHGLQSVGEDRAIKARAELLHAAEQAGAQDRLGVGLQDPQPVIAGHHAQQRDDCVAVHHAVGIHDQHEVIVAAPAPTEIGNVAELGVGVGGAPAIEKASLRKGVAQRMDRRFLGNAMHRLTAVGQQEIVKMPRVLRVRGDDRLPSCRHARSNARRVCRRKVRRRYGTDANDCCGRRAAYTRCQGSS